MPVSTSERRPRGAFLAAGLLAAGLAWGQGDGDAEQRKRLVEQKMRLVELLVNSPAAQAPAAAEAAERSKALLGDARKAAAAGQFDNAAQLLDEAVRGLSRQGGRAGADASLSASAQRKQNDDLREQISTYRGAIRDLEKDARQGAAARKLLVRVDTLTAEGDGLAGEGRAGDAGRKYAEAYKVAVEELSRLRAGQEVVLALKFDTPADEFAYEQRRFASGEVLVASLLQEGRGEGEKRRQIDAWLGEARQIRGEGEALAGRRQYRDAIAMMEKASGVLNRALQLMGVPVF
ncbi:MAG: hypothetical protein FIB06_00135 [Betaproteobacteria bacterium]|nr:hypothetical protein [Betaproteobacteria bacterium]